MLCFAQAYFRRDARIADGRGRRCARTSLSTRDDDEVGFCLGHTGGDGSHTAFGHQFHADGGARVHILQIEDELCQVFDGVDVVVGRRRDERDARDGVARAGNDLVHLEAWQLSAFARLGTLGHLDLYLLGVHQILCRYAETSRSYLLRLAGEADTVHRVVEACVVFTTFARVAARAQFVHGQCQCLMCLLADGAERDGARNEMFHDALYRLHLFDVNRIAAETEEVAQEDGTLLFVHHAGKLLELLVAAGTGGQLQSADSFRIPGVVFSVFAVGHLSDIRQERVCRFGHEAVVVEGDVVFGNLFQTDAADGRGGGTEVTFEQFLAQPHRFEYLGAAVRADSADTHLAHDFVESLADGLDVVLLRRFIVHLYLALLHQVVQHGVSHVGADGTGTVAQQQGGVHHFANFAALHDKSCLYALLHTDEVMVYGADGQQ